MSRIVSTTSFFLFLSCQSPPAHFQIREQLSLDISTKITNSGFLDEVHTKYITIHNGAKSMDIELEGSEYYKLFVRESTLTKEGKEVVL